MTLRSHPVCRRVAHVLFEHLGVGDDEIRFATRSGELIVSRSADGVLGMDFPAKRGDRIDTPEGLHKALARKPNFCIGSKPMIAVFDSADDIAAIVPDFRELKRIGLEWGGIGLVGTARYAGDEPWDFVSRVFAPALGINEDPVT